MPQVICASKSQSVFTLKYPNIASEKQLKLIFLNTLKTKLINKHFKFPLTIQYETCSSDADYCSSSIYHHSGGFQFDIDFNAAKYELLEI